MGGVSGRMGTDCGHRPPRDVIMIAHFRKAGQITRESGTSSEEGNVVAKCSFCRHLPIIGNTNAHFDQENVTAGDKG